MINLDNYWALGADLPELEKQERFELIKLLREYDLDDLELTGVQGQFLIILQVYKRLITDIKNTINKGVALKKFNANQNETSAFKKLMDEQNLKDEDGISKNKISRITINFKGKDVRFESEFILSYFIKAMNAFHSRLNQTPGYRNTRKYSKGPGITSAIIDNPFHILPLCYFLKDNFSFINKTDIAKFVFHFLRIAGAPWNIRQGLSYTKKIYDNYTQSASALAHKLGVGKNQVDARKYYLP